MKFKIINIIFMTITFLALSFNSFAEMYEYSFMPQNDDVVINPVIVKFNGKIYPSGWWFSQIKNGDFTPGDDEKFIIEFISINATGTADNIISLYSDDSREAINNLVSDLEVFTNSKNYFKSITDSAFLAKIYYGKYTIFFIQHGINKTDGFINYIPIIFKNGKYNVSKALEDDPIYLYFFSRFEEKLIWKSK